MLVRWMRYFYHKKPFYNLHQTELASHLAPHVLDGLATRLLQNHSDIPTTGTFTSFWCSLGPLAFSVSASDEPETKELPEKFNLEVTHITSSHFVLPRTSPVAQILWRELKHCREAVCLCHRL